MANPQHLEWLKEGVAAWNERRLKDGFRPDLMGADLVGAKLVGADLREADLRRAKLGGADLREADLREARLGRADLREADLGGADLGGANFREARLGRANLREANLGEANLGGANLREADLGGARLGRAHLRGANLREARLGRADLGGANLGGANLREARLGGADIRTVNTGSPANDGIDPVFTDFTFAYNLTPRQIATMRGDTGVKLPEGMEHPSDWPHWQDLLGGGTSSDDTSTAPELPSDAPIGDRVAEVNGKITIATGGAPERDDLASLFSDLRDDVADLRNHGNLSNFSPVFERALQRFLDTVPDAYEDLEQVRFAVAAEKMNLIFASSKDDIAKASPEKIGFFEAVFFAADLLKERLPEWRAFLAENTSAHDAIAENKDDFAKVANDASRGLKSAPETFDPALADRLEEYTEGDTIEGKLAAKSLIVKIAYWVFSEARKLQRDLVDESRKIVIKGIAGAFLASLGGVCLRLAGMLPAELPWVLRWLEYLPTLL